MMQVNSISHSFKNGPLESTASNIHFISLLLHPTYFTFIPWNKTPPSHPTSFFHPSSFSISFFTSFSFSRVTFFSPTFFCCNTANTPTVRNHMVSICSCTSSSLAQRSTEESHRTVGRVVTRNSKEGPSMQFLALKTALVVFFHYHREICRMPETRQHKQSCNSLSRGATYIGAGTDGRIVTITLKRWLQGWVVCLRVRTSASARVPKDGNKQRRITASSQSSPNIEKTRRCRQKCDCSRLCHVLRGALMLRRVFL